MKKIKPESRFQGPWTRFMDMHSGGGQKEDWPYIYIQASEDYATKIFYSKFGHNPERVTCTCCGEDYSISESEDLYQASGYDRGCAWGRDENRYIEKQSSDRGYKNYTTLEDYIEKDDVKFIFSDEITPYDRMVDVPDEGYIWH